MRGINKNVVVMKMGAVSPFEAVYFVMKRSADAKKADVVREANRIVEQNGCSRKSQGGKRRTFALVSFALGAVVGALISAALISLLF